MKSLPRLRELLAHEDADRSVSVEYAQDDRGEGDYYCIKMQGTMPRSDFDVTPEMFSDNEQERMAKRFSLGNALQLKLVDFIFGKSKRVNSELVLLDDQSKARAGVPSDLTHYHFEFHIDAEKLDGKRSQLSARTQEQASLFHDSHTLHQWMEIQQRRDEEASRKIFKPRDGGMSL